jgi:hypothetical protein
MRGITFFRSTKGSHDDVTRRVLAHVAVYDNASAAVYSKLYPKI